MSDNADLPLPGGHTMHLTTYPGVLPPFVIIPGSPARADYIAQKHLSRAELVSQPGGREYRCWIGNTRGTALAIAVVTHHMGGGSMGTILPELEASGGRIIIRVGSCSSFVPNARPGDLAIIESEIRWDGASDEILDPRVPAVADRHVLRALEAAAQQRRLRHHVGMGATAITFYHGQGRPDPDGYVSPHIQERIALSRRLELVSLQMETATLLTWATTRRHAGVRAGAIHAIYANRSVPDGELVEAKGDDEAIQVAIAALESLAQISTHI